MTQEQSLARKCDGKRKCRDIVKALRPTMAYAKKDSVAAMVPASLLHRIYQLAKDGSK